MERHVDGGLTATELKFGVGYVPPPPENYQETSDRLDAARRAAESAAARGARPGRDAVSRHRRTPPRRA